MNVKAKEIDDENLNIDPISIKKGIKCQNVLFSL